MREAFLNPDPDIWFEALYPQNYHPVFPGSAFRTYRKVPIDLIEMGMPRRPSGGKRPRGSPIPSLSLRRIPQSPLP
ncbi:MAG: hypothetical protein LBL04_00825 [Bacteroidales bacterium]|nr:hypothetical protein [Bacteroidales bacterium]